MVTPGDSTGAAAVTVESDSFMKTNEVPPDDSHGEYFAIDSIFTKMEANNPSKLGC